ncbi:OmpA family protein [Skermanella mucosa]|uniref:OmpA family protein n=1 Tax=Skermanella mucosa TaxID=1789672 RepID=UPI00192B54F4|nr:OmpA family protein [Skermanella mucosa]UEM19429.1 OmpA family protein [Skermanella mucosa]
MSRYVPTAVRRMALGCALGAATIPWPAGAPAVAQETAATASPAIPPGIPARKPAVPGRGPEASAASESAPTAAPPVAPPVANASRPLPVPPSPGLGGALPTAPAGRAAPPPPGLDVGVPPDIAAAPVPPAPSELPRAEAPAGVQFDTPVPPAAPGEPRRITSMPDLPNPRGPDPRDGSGPARPAPEVAATPPAPSGPSAEVPDGTEFRVVYPDTRAETLSPRDTALLDGVAARLRRDEVVRLQVTAYASGTPETERDARRLSLDRALAVRSYLIGQGVRSTRIDVRALGTQAPDGPADRVDLILVN